MAYVITHYSWVRVGERHIREDISLAEGARHNNAALGSDEGSAATSGIAVSTCHM